MHTNILAFPFRKGMCGLLWELWAIPSGWGNMTSIWNVHILSLLLILLRGIWTLFIPLWTSFEPELTDDLTQNIRVDLLLETQNSILILQKGDQKPHWDGDILKVTATGWQG